MTSRRILVVDDNPDDIELCTRALQAVSTVNYGVQTMTEPSQVVACVRKSNCDCVIIDFHFPATSGLEVLNLLRSEFPFLPIVFLTGQQDDTLAAQLIKSGAQDYINKAALSPDTLHTVISDAIVRADTERTKNIRSGSYCNVLIIDDNPDDIEFCVRSLKRKSQRYRYQSASTGEEGLSLIESFLPDCVILDHSLPGTSGIDLLPQILSVVPHVPVIIMTGQGNEMIAVEAMKRGAENYLIKSKLDADALDKNIKDAVEKKRLEMELAKKETFLQEKQQQLTDANSFLDLVIGSLPDYVFVKDEQFRLVKGNSAFLSLYPDPENVIGYTTVEAYPKDEAERFLAKDREAFDKGHSEVEETITFPNGEIRTLYTQKKRFENTRGERFVLGVGTDITERERMIAQLQKSNLDLEQFAYVASHDLRSPLNAIKKLVGWIEEDCGEALPEQALEHFELIKQRADRMGNLLNDLLSYAKVSSKLEEEESIGFGDFCRQIFELNERCEFYEFNVPLVQIRLPRIALQIVLLNLINNAIKHHHQERGKINVAISSVSGGYLLVVEDDGPGIPNEYAEKVFEMFQTLESRDQVEGSGMGLAMVKKVVEFYSGQVYVNSEYQSGCQIKIFWPAKNNPYEKENQE